jgi:hypothetical protein
VEPVKRNVVRLVVISIILVFESSQGKQLYGLRYMCLLTFAYLEKFELEYIIL